METKTAGSKKEKGANGARARTKPRVRVTEEELLAITKDILCGREGEYPMRLAEVVRSLREEIAAIRARGWIVDIPSPIVGAASRFADWDQLDPQEGGGDRAEGDR